MKICKYCATKYEDEKKVCPSCGAKEFYTIMDDSSNSNEKNSSKKHRRFKPLTAIMRAPKVIQGLLLGFLLAVCVLIGIKLFFDRPVPDEPIVSKTVDLGFKDIGELATQSFYYTNVQVNSDSRTLFNFDIPLTKSKYIYSYDGEIKAGLDFDKIEYSIDHEAGVITLQLPEIKIISNELDQDSFRIYDESKNIFNPLEITSLNDGQKAVKTEAEQKAFENGLYEKALENAKVLITALCNSLYPDYTVEYK